MWGYSRDPVGMPIFVSTRSRGRHGLALATALVIVVAALAFRLP